MKSDPAKSSMANERKINLCSCIKSISADKLLTASLWVKDIVANHKKIHDSSNEFDLRINSSIFIITNKIITTYSVLNLV
jgi:hypothetical protein